MRAGPHPAPLHQQLRVVRAANGYLFACGGRAGVSGGSCTPAREPPAKSARADCGSMAGGTERDVAGWFTHANYTEFVYSV